MTYPELMKLYFQARSSVISEFSGSIATETCTLFRRCNTWLTEQGFDPMKPDEMTAMYLEWEKEGGC